MKSYKELDNQLKNMKGNEYYRNKNGKRVISKFYSNNSLKIDKAELFSRMRTLQYRDGSYKNVTLPTAVTILFGVLISLATILYSEFRTELYGKFIDSVEESFLSNGYSMAEIKIILNGEINKIVTGVKLEICMALAVVMCIIIIVGLIYHRLLKLNYKRSIDTSELIDYEISLIEKILLNPIGNRSEILRIEDGTNVFIYKLDEIICNRLFFLRLILRFIYIIRSMKFWRNN